MVVIQNMSDVPSSSCMCHVFMFHMSCKKAPKRFLKDKPDAHGPKVCLRKITQLVGLL